MSKVPVKKILVSQPEPKNNKSPFFDLADKYKVQVDFRPFIHVEGVEAKEFRKQKINLEEFTAIVLTSKTAVDHFFRTCEEMKVPVDQDLKYFCVAESVATYLQKYIQMRKRKVHFGKGVAKSLVPLMNKHKTEKFLMPCSDVHEGALIELFSEHGLDVKEAIMYRTVCSDLSDLTSIKYDIIVFYSPSGIKSLYENFPDFEQEDRRIAVFGKKTQLATQEAGLVVNIQAPAPGLPSMTMAIADYLENLKA